MKRRFGIAIGAFAVLTSAICAAPLHVPGEANVFCLSSAAHPDNAVVFDFCLPHVEMSNIHLPEFGSGKRVVLEDRHGVAPVPGAPDVESVKCLVQIPDRGGVDVSVSAVASRVLENITIAPAQHPVPVGSDDSLPYVIDSQVYSENAYYPRAIAALENCEILREIRVAVVKINPIRYNPVTRQVELITQARITVKPRFFERGPNELNLVDRELTPSFMPLYDDVLNFDRNRAPAVRKTPGCYLFMGPEKNLQAVEELMQWKKQKGYTVKTASPGQDGVPTDANGIDKWIEDAYATWDPKPEYILFVGCEQVMPTIQYIFPMSKPPHKFAADYIYSVIGDSQVPAMSVGRITGNKATNEDDPQVLKYLVWKTLKHDKEAPDGDWRTRHIAYACHSQGKNGNDGIGLKIQKEWLGFSAGTFASLVKGTDKSSPEGGNVMNAADFSARFNEGAAFVTYVGHGTEHRWSNLGLEESHVQAFTNGTQFPIVWSLACKSGAWLNNHCLYEHFMDAGSIDDPKGAVAVFGFSTNSGDNCNGLISNGLKNYFQKKIYKMGPALIGARQFAKSAWDAASSTFFGCPEIDLITVAQPNVLKVECGSIQTGTCTFSVTSNGEAVENAMVGVVATDLSPLGAGYTDASGKAQIVLKNVTPNGEVQVTVSGHNCRPTTATFKSVQ